MKMKQTTFEFSICILWLSRYSITVGLTRCGHPLRSGDDIRNHPR